MPHISFFVDDVIYSKFKNSVGNRGMTKTFVEFMNNYASESDNDKEILSAKLAVLEADNAKRKAAYDVIKHRYDTILKREESVASHSADVSRRLKEQNIQFKQFGKNMIVFRGRSIIAEVPADKFNPENYIRDDGK
jgi:hypothetical protein